MAKKKGSKKKKKLLLLLYKSGIEGKGKPVPKVVYSTLTPSQYRTRFYGSAYHEQTEYAIRVKRI